MGFHKDTMKFYLHESQDAAFQGTKTAQVGGDLSPRNENDYVYRNKNNDADLTVSNGTIAEVISDITQYHTTTTEDPYPKTVVTYKVWGNVADAKAGMITPTVLTALDTHCDRQEWALEEGDTCLKLTRDWKTLTSHTDFKTAVDGRWSAADSDENPDNGYLKFGGLMAESGSHLF